ncbi:MULTISPECIES: DsbA family oxidoreductase [unclassified Haematospirillum]|uniref:DsbA family oxidoreductase n=1 Tax=unclassified Haematospirillum TaxID=2622088 RepID=UPI00143B61B5|nr:MULTISPECIES: DsbA family oxidoreductase [unclassified Haematospirillum]NKD54305.1 DsbA family oxidoreductase [Haematospirillum sp. H4890]NKD74349.1 DsbA family oxidoreductase [Haematospirillum sp. H4485]NKD86980.1 DsbA family oxidoreductase [Haematospirillum sp. 15-248]
MIVEIIFDTVCPWCYIGSRRLSKALSNRTATDVRVRWRPFILNPEIAKTGMLRSAYLERKFGSLARANRILAGQVEAGAREGIHFNFASIETAPNSTASHQLMLLAGSHGVASDFLEVIFSAYFEKGLDIGNNDTLYELATQFGLASDDVLHSLQDETSLATVMAENAATHRMNITGVPCFIFNHDYAIAGAQESEILARMLDIASEGSVAEPMTMPAQKETETDPNHFLVSRPS